MGGVVDVRHAAQVLEVQARVGHADPVQVAVNQPVEQVAVVEPGTLRAGRAAGVADDVDCAVVFQQVVPLRAVGQFMGVASKIDERPSLEPDLVVRQHTFLLFFSVFAKRLKNL